MNNLSLGDSGSDTQPCFELSAGSAEQRLAQQGRVYVDEMNNFSAQKAASSPTQHRLEMSALQLWVQRAVCLMRAAGGGSSGEGA